MNQRTPPTAITAYETSGYTRSSLTTGKFETFFPPTSEPTFSLLSRGEVYQAAETAQVAIEIYAPLATVVIPTYCIMRMLTAPSIAGGTNPTAGGQIRIGTVGSGASELAAGTRTSFVNTGTTAMSAGGCISLSMSTPNFATTPGGVCTQGKAVKLYLDAQGASPTSWTCNYQFWLFGFAI